MHVEFLLGPAGSGKTFRCLQEVREALGASPDGEPLLLIAPKQATYQLERQLLSDGAVVGYTRLRIVSFERLAKLIFTLSGHSEPRLLNAEGRSMVLQALLSRLHSRLKKFGASARFPGFTEELTQLIQQLHQQRLSPASLGALAREAPGRSKEKLEDLALLFGEYETWLRSENLKDGDSLLALAAERLEQSPALRIDAVWLDGFARVTPQERQLLKVLIRRCDKATLAFCLDEERASEPWHSHWFAVNESVAELKKELKRAGARIRMRIVGKKQAQLELLENFGGASSRFLEPELQHLERYWESPRPMDPYGQPAVRLIECGSVQDEATLAARDILRHVRAGGRFRETAVLVRNLDGYHDVLRRVFLRYEIPFFLDRREPIAHHPVAELTRSALRIIAFNWRTDDWFCALKTGLVPATDAEIDGLENEALGRGWEGAQWLKPLVIRNKPDLEEEVERLRQKLVAPFHQLARDIGPEPTGEELQRGLIHFWQSLGVEQTLQQWTDEAPASERLHETVWEQITSFVENLALAFRRQSQGLRQWIPILERGLETLSVGVIPPVLDQVLIGGVDRSRNPDLEHVFVLGINEGVFPARAAQSVILNESELELLEASGAHLGTNKRVQAGVERYLGYIACTRARKRLTATYALKDCENASLTPSSLVKHLQRLFPRLRQPEIFDSHMRSQQPEHYSELIAPLLAADPRGPLSRIRELAPVANVLDRVQRSDPTTPTLSPRLAEALFGTVHETSVSALEKFGQCPFWFFVDSGLKAEERASFELDFRQQGTFQHEILEEFHRRLEQTGRTWHGVTQEEARKEAGRIADELIPQFAEGMLLANEANRFLALEGKERLQSFVELLIGWMQQYEFEPARVEWSFGLHQSELPAWKIDLGGGRALALRGTIDRLDIHQDSNAEEALAVVMDYKASLREINRLFVDHGIQLQLPAYIAALRQLDAASTLGVRKLRPVGGFFVNLRGNYPSAANREEALADKKDVHKAAFQHRGLFDVSALDILDNRGASEGDQFKYKRAASGEPKTSEREAMERVAFEALLDATEEQLRKFGGEVLSGRIAIDPYKHGNMKACRYCENAAICRIDPWMHSFRRLEEKET